VKKLFSLLIIALLALSVLLVTVKVPPGHAATEDVFVTGITSAYTLNSPYVRWHGAINYTNTGSLPENATVFLEAVPSSNPNIEYTLWSIAFDSISNPPIPPTGSGVWEYWWFAIPNATGCNRPGHYHLRAVIYPSDGYDPSKNTYDNGPDIELRGGGCCIVVAGNAWHQDNYTFDNLASLAYRTLRSVGYRPSDICYMNDPGFFSEDSDNDGIYDVSCASSFANLEWAIDGWAKLKCSPMDPLTIYLVDHGVGPDENGHYVGFAVNWDYGAADILNASQLGIWLDDLQNATGCVVNVIVDCCGSAIFQVLARPDRIIVTSTNGEYAEGGGAFGPPFWDGISSGGSIKAAWMHASEMMERNAPDCVPWLNDSTEYFSFAYTMYIHGPGSDEFHPHLPEFSHPYSPPFWCIKIPPTPQHYSPNSDVTLWAKIGNSTNLRNVTAWIVPPDMNENNPTGGNLTLPGPEYFEMVDVEGNGNWTVTVPVSYFRAYYSGPCNFTFFIVAYDKDGDIGVCGSGMLKFTNSEEPVPDVVPPVVSIWQPSEGSIIGGNVTLNGTATDDTCLDRIEVFSNGTLMGTYNASQTSTSFFEFNIDTTALPNGNATFLVKAYDTAGNSGNETLNVLVQNGLHGAKILGDINGDGKVDGRDITMAAWGFGTRPGDPRWNPDCDINGDNKVDGRDITLIARNFGK